MSSVPTAQNSTILSLQTSATGTNFVTFSSTACNCLNVENSTNTVLEYQRGGSGNAFPIPSGTSSYLITGIKNANEIGFRRKDTSNTQVVLAAEAFTV